MNGERFEGWYFKHQRGTRSLAFIPGRAEGGAFVQMIGEGGSRHFDVDGLCLKDGVIRAGNCVFSKDGAWIDLPGVRGCIGYGPLTPIKGDIMGPFRHLPMECRHGVISMGHTLSGSVLVDGRETAFDGGTGYIECDSGTSFPSSYQWVQCNAFAEPTSIMASVARIPFMGFHFTGCISAIIHRGKEYRLATYRGARIRAAGPGHIRLSQGRLAFEVDIHRCSGGYPLRSPMRGRMNGVIRENTAAFARFRLWEDGTLVFDLESGCAGYEYVE